MIFQDFVNDVTYGHQWKQTELFNYFRAQIDVALLHGWDPSDIIICTNLDFSYKSVQIIKLSNECKFNKYFNKQYGILELLERGILTEPFWFHDFDDWPLQKFEFPEFAGDIGFCKYINHTQLNTGSIFIKPSSIDIWALIVEFMELNKDNDEINSVGDENIVNMVHMIYSDFLYERISILNNKFNVGCTQFEQRLQKADIPVCVAAFKPDEECASKFVTHGLIQSNILDIFKKHDLYE